MIILKKSKVVKTHWVENLHNHIVQGYGTNNTDRTRVIKTGIVGLRDISVELGNISRRREKVVSPVDMSTAWGRSAGVSIFGLWAFLQRWFQGQGMLH